MVDNGEALVWYGRANGGNTLRHMENLHSFGNRANVDWAGAISEPVESPEAQQQQFFEQRTLCVENALSIQTSVEVSSRKLF